MELTEAALFSSILEPHLAKPGGYWRRVTLQDMLFSIPNAHRDSLTVGPINLFERYNHL